MNREIWSGGDNGGTSKPHGLDINSLQLGDARKTGDDRVANTLLQKMRHATLDANLTPKEGEQLGQLEAAIVKPDPNKVAQLVKDANSGDRASAERVLTALAEALTSVGIGNRVSGDAQDGFRLSLFQGGTATEPARYVMTFNPDGQITHPDRQTTSMSSQFPVSMRSGDMSGARYAVNEPARRNYAGAFMPATAGRPLATQAEIPPGPTAFMQKLRKSIST